jgi:hypothetical protein
MNDEVNSIASFIVRLFVLHSSFIIHHSSFIVHTWSFHAHPSQSQSISETARAKQGESVGSAAAD